MEDFLCLVDPKDPDYTRHYKGWYGGRASGKSTQVARAALIRGLREPKKILCAREYRVSVDDSILTLLSNQIKVLGLSDFYNVQNRKIYGRNGTKFIFKGLTVHPGTIRSTEGVDICLIMEAQFISEQSWIDLDPTIRDDNSEVWIEWNPHKDSDPVHQRFIKSPPQDSFIRRVNYDKNPWFSKVSRAQMEHDRKRDFDLYLHIWEGQTLKRSEAQVFKHYRIDGNISPSDGDVLYYGSDFGFSVDPTTLVRMWINEDKRELYIDYEAYGIGVEIDETPDLYDSVPGSREWKITADCSRPETISYLKRQGFKMRSSKKGAGSVIEGVKFLQSYDIVIHPRCVRTLAEFTHYCWKVDKLTNEILPILTDGSDHIIDACRYALESLFGRVRINIG